MANIFPCPSCGGQLVYNIKTKEMKCRSCGSSFPADGYQSKEFNSEREVVSCPNCGGEVAAPSLDGMNFCPYCGSEITNAEHFSKKGYPEYIIPFGISKKRTIKIYKDMVKKVPFLPDDLKTDEGLKSFVGLYTPYWIYNFEGNGNVTLPVSKTESRGEYTYNYTADISSDLNCGLSVGIDASQTLDDTVSEKVEPFYYEKLEKFNPNYMAGFYAENSTVKPSIYKDVSYDKAGEAIFGRLEDEAESHGGYTISGGYNDVTEKIKSHLTRSEKKCTGAYLPLWFLTTKKNDRVAYTVINGQTGASYSDLPVDIPKYIRGSLILSAAIAVVLMTLFAVFGTLDMGKIPYITLILSSIMMITASVQANRIYRKENHLDDIGYDPKTAKEKAKKRKPKADKRMKTLIPVTVTGIIMITSGIGAYIIWLLAIAAVIVMLAKARGSASWMAVLAGIGIIMSAGVIITDPADDIILYGLMTATLAILILDAVKLTKAYNKIATNPLPQFGKKGGI